MRTCIILDQSVSSRIINVISWNISWQKRVFRYWVLDNRVCFLPCHFCEMNCSQCWQISDLSLPGTQICSDANHKLHRNNTIVSSSLLSRENNWLSSHCKNLNTCPLGSYLTNHGLNKITATILYTVLTSIYYHAAWIKKRLRTFYTLTGALTPTHT